MALYSPAILLLGIHTEETRIERDTCTPMFIAALFTIARTWKQPRCPSADEWIRKLWYIYTMEYYSTIKKNTFESVLMRWMKLEPTIQSEVSQKRKHILDINAYIWNFRINLSISTKQFNCLNFIYCIFYNITNKKNLSSSPNLHIHTHKHTQHV